MPLTRPGHVALVYDSGTKTVRACRDGEDGLLQHRKQASKHTTMPTMTSF
jgi:hypothetical protein